MDCVSFSVVGTGHETCLLFFLHWHFLRSYLINFFLKLKIHHFTMTTATTPTSHHRLNLFHHRHSHHIAETDGHPKLTAHTIFEGTDAIPHNRKVALQKVVEVHKALDLKQREESNVLTDREPAASPKNSFATDLDLSDVPDGEVRAFKYFLRKWDPKEIGDPQFDLAITQSRPQFEEAAIKHFFRRIALWDGSEEMVETSEQEKRKRCKQDNDSTLSNLWLLERGSQEHILRDRLKEVTTREGLAQLLWTLIHDKTAPVAPGMAEECTEALKKMVKCADVSTSREEASTSTVKVIPHIGSC
jgi:hypothetical protein